jgi:C_GCAxxG_C_C family probable redox protein
MLKDLIEKYYFTGNYNCAETVLHAANEYYGLELPEREMKLVSGFGAGMQTGNVCGALLAAISVLSMRYVETKAHESAEIKPVTTLLTEKFMNALNGSLLCREIKPAYFREEVRCLATVQAACDVIELAIREYEETK